MAAACSCYGCVAPSAQLPLVVWHVTSSGQRRRLQVWETPPPLQVSDRLLNPLRYILGGGNGFASHIFNQERQILQNWQGGGGAEGGETPLRNRVIVCKLCQKYELCEWFAPVMWFVSAMGSPGRMPGGPADSTALRPLPAPGAPTTVTRSPRCPGTSAVCVPNLGAARDRTLSQQIGVFTFYPCFGPCIHHL